MFEITPPFESNEPAQEQQEQDFEYKLLQGHYRTDGTYKTDEQLRLEYIQLTDSLVHQMTDGVEVTDPQTGEKTRQKPDVVVFLDKSARPLAWLTKDLWPTLAPEPGSDEVPPMPDFKFVNIDREQWVNTVDPEGVGSIDIKKVDKGILRSLRSIFVSPNDKQHGLTEEIDEAESELDNKTILIVDEVRSTGRTLQYAREFFSAAFPTARIATTHWMSGVAFKGGATGNRDLPVWYKDNDIYGRGVGNRDAAASQKSDNSTQKYGAWFLSRRLPETDTQALQLRKELRHLAENPDVPIVPARTRSRESQMARLAILNNAPAEEVVRRVQEVKAQRR